MTRSLALAALLALTGCQAAPQAPAVPAAGDGVALLRGPIAASGDPADLAIDGDAYFVLARRLPVAATEDLIFTRDGDFRFAFIPDEAPGSGRYRLVNADGLAVMGWRSPVDVNVRPFGTSPAEATGAGLAAFTTTAPNGTGPGLPVALAPVELDHAANPDAAGQLAFDAQGMLRLGGDTPRDGGGPINLHVVLAQPEHPQALRHEGGGYLAWAPATGSLSAGTAAKSGLADHPIGQVNVLRPGAVERLPLLTPSRYDRDRYPDALDPLAVLPAGEAALRGALVTAVQPLAGGAAAVKLVALGPDGAPTGPARAVTVPAGFKPVQRRGDVLRPVVAGGLARGAIADVWLGPDDRALALVLDRDDRPDDGLDAFGPGWL